MRNAMVNMLAWALASILVGTIAIARILNRLVSPASTLQSLTA